MLVATLVMGIACGLLKMSPLYPHAHGRLIWMLQLTLLLGAGVAVYLGTCLLLGVSMMKDLLPGRKRTVNQPSR
jgi:uncharacterized membrane protein YczE